MILEVDMGNSNLKWRLKDGDDVIADGISDNNNRKSYEDAFELLPGAINKVLVSSVVLSANEAFTQWSLSRLGVKPHFAQVRRECAGVTNAYRDVSQMGVDRWLAMLAAFSVSQKACLVVDVGSACTVDLLARSGEHLGGYIGPGLRLMRESLFRDTDRVKLDVIDYDNVTNAGISTQSAVASALCVMQLGLVRHALEELLSYGDQDLVIVLTGGGASGLINLLQPYAYKYGCNMDVRPSLVMDGLCLAIPE